MYRLTYDGSVAEEHGFIVMGGNSDPIATYVRERHDPKASLGTALKLAAAALVQPVADGSEARSIAGDDLEAAVLDRTRPRRAFKRLQGTPLQKLLEDKKA
jgi:proteasome alpha subunit